MMLPSTRNRRRQRGAILVQALLVVAMLVTLIAMMAATQRVTLEGVQNVLRQRRIDISARSAVARALTVLNTTNTNLVALTDDWAQLGDSGNTSYDLGNGTTFRMQIVDSSSLINLNTAAQAQLDELPLSQEEVAGLIDWRSAGETASANGAKDDLYNGLQTPYNAKLAPLTTVSELLLINGWTAHDLYSTQTDNVSSAGPLQDSNGNALPLIAVVTADSGMPNTQASGTARTNVGVGRLTAQTFQRLGIRGNVANTLAARGPYTTWAALLRQNGVTTANAETLLQSATVKTGTRLTGLINLNTATQAVLQTIPNVTPDVATAIVAQQATGFPTLGTLGTVSGLTTVTRMAQIADYVGVGSDTFTVRIYAQSGGVGQAYEVLIGIRNQTTPTTTGTTTTTGSSSGSGPVVLSYTRLSAPGIPSYWSWTADTTNTVDAAAQQTTGTTTTAAATSAGGSTGGSGR